MRPLVLAVLLATGCGQPAPPPPEAPAQLSNAAPVTATEPHVVLATLERTACYGTCPIYKVTVYRDGAIEWAGEKFVKVVGAASGHATAAQLQKLRDAFARADYAALRDKYESYDVTDNPSAITSFSDGGRVKTVSHYYGDTHVPESLGQLETAIDEILETTRWVGTGEERGKAGY